MGLIVYYPPHINTFLPSFKAGGSSVELSAEDFRKLLSTFLRDVDVDEEWYLENYPDVAVAIGDGHVANASAHYISAGYAEGRFPCHPNVDAKDYLERYPDLAKAYEQGAMDEPDTHFRHVGYREARIGTTFPVDEAWYLKKYNVQLTADIPSAREHFYKAGYMQGFRPFPLEIES